MSQPDFINKTIDNNLTISLNAINTGLNNSLRNSLEFTGSIIDSRRKMRIQIKTANNQDSTQSYS